MSLLQWLAFFGLTIGLRWVASHWVPHADAYVLAGLFAGFLGWTAYRRAQLLPAADALRSPPPVDPQLPAPADAPGSVAPAPSDTTLTFAYPAGSRALKLLGLLLNTILGLGFLVPIALGGSDDPANGWVLFLLGVACLLTALQQAATLHWLGTWLVLSPEGLTRHGHVSTIHIRWTEVAGVRTFRFPSRLALVARDGAVISIYPQLRDFRAFVSAASQACDQARAPAAHIQ